MTSALTKNFLIATCVLTGISALEGCQKNQPATPTATSQPAAQTTSAGGDAMSDKGVGPITEVSIGPLDPKLAEKGKATFQAKCSACHKIDEKFVGPALKGVTQRRRPEWIMNMILNPTEMTQQDPIAKDLLGQYLTQMANQNLTKDEARSVLEFFRQNDGAK